MALLARCLATHEAITMEKYPFGYKWCCNQKQNDTHFTLIEKKEIFFSFCYFLDIANFPSPYLFSRLYLKVKAAHWKWHLLNPSTYSIGGISFKSSSVLSLVSPLWAHILKVAFRANSIILGRGVLYSNMF